MSLISFSFHSKSFNSNQKVQTKVEDVSFSFNILKAGFLTNRSVDIQAEECALRSNVDRFNTRRYGSLLAGVNSGGPGGSAGGPGGPGGGPGGENCGSGAPSESALTVNSSLDFYRRFNYRRLVVYSLLSPHPLERGR